MNARVLPTISADGLRPLPSESTLRVHGYDVDLVGIVHNTVFIRWLEDMRSEWCDVYLPIPQQIADGYCPIVTSVQVEYKAPVRFLDRVTGRIWVHLTRARWQAEFEISANANLAARATQTGVFVNLPTLKPIAVPPALMAKYHAFLENQSGDQEAALPAAVASGTSTSRPDLTPQM